MSLDSEYREVRYDIYCEQCKHKEETCYESDNEDSTKPIFFKENK